MAVIEALADFSPLAGCIMINLIIGQKKMLLMMQRRGKCNQSELSDTFPSDLKKTQDTCTVLVEWHRFACQQQSTKTKRHSVDVDLF